MWFAFSMSFLSQWQKPSFDFKKIAIFYPVFVNKILVQKMAWTVWDKNLPFFPLVFVKKKFWGRKWQRPFKIKICHFLPRFCKQNSGAGENGNSHFKIEIAIFYHVVFRWYILSVTLFSATYWLKLETMKLSFFRKLGQVSY